MPKCKEGFRDLKPGTENRNGCPFLDVQNRPDFTDDNSIIYGHHMQNFGTVREHTDWLKEVSGRSDFRANLEISAYDRVITLSTCAYRFENARYVLHGKLVELR